MSEKVADQRQGGQAVVVRVVVASAAREMGTGAVQNHSNEGKLAWVQQEFMYPCSWWTSWMKGTSSA